jgi:catechol 2,3-dioxygenase-like lactoylglutathione lyase family enzyme
VRAADQFHVGIVVDDLDRAVDELTELFGYGWCDEIDVVQPVRVPTGPIHVRFRFRYSRTTPRLEVIHGQPGTLWSTDPGSGIHHLGYWSDDVAADGAALHAAGYQLEAASDDGDGAPTWSFHRAPDGPRIELISRALEPLVATLWADPR